MNAQKSINVSFRFDDGKVFSPSIVESLAQAACSAAQSSPLSIANLPFFESAKAVDWFSGKTISKGGFVKNGANNKKRLRAIKVGNELLLEHSYSVEGRLARTQYADGEIVNYEWDEILRTCCIRANSGRQMLAKFHHDDLVASITYDKDRSFIFEYGDDNKMTRLFYPDGVRSERTFGPHGELITVECGPMRVTHR